jgi:glycosyltransferase involved in cell wall biosynthesis
MGRRLGIPALFSLYCPASLLPSKLPMDSYCIKVLSLGLDKIIAVTTNVKVSLTKCGVATGKIEVLPSCFDEKAFSTSAYDLAIHKKASAENSKVRKVLFVGNLDKTKGLDIFLAAAKSVLRTNPEVKFVITLHEPYESLQSVRVLASRSLGSSVEVFGVVNNMAKLMVNADVVVAPFRSTEGISDIPLIVLEAMALGKPVVASNIEGIKEVISDGENGVLVDLNHPDELANAIINLLNDPNLREEISNQAILCAKRFSYSEISRRLSDLYLKIIENA